MTFSPNSVNERDKAARWAALARELKGPGPRAAYARADLRRELFTTSNADFILSKLPAEEWEVCFETLVEAAVEHPELLLRGENVEALARELERAKT